MTRNISFGVLLIPCQTLDVVGPLDQLFNINKSTITLYGSVLGESVLPKSLIDAAPEFTFHHIGPTMDPVELTAKFSAAPTCTVDNCPELDYLLIGGTDPSYAMNMPAPMRQFMIDRSSKVKTVFTTCTGALILSATGVLDGLRATANHAFVGFGSQMAPAVKWDREPLWVVDKRAETGVEFWTAAGAVAGMDMMAEWIRQQFGKELLNISTMALEYAPRDINAKPVTFMNGKGEMVKA